MRLSQLRALGPHPQPRNYHLGSKTLMGQIGLKVAPPARPSLHRLNRNGRLPLAVGHGSNFSDEMRF